MNQIREIISRWLHGVAVQLASPEQRILFQIERLTTRVSEIGEAIDKLEQKKQEVTKSERDLFNLEALDDNIRQRADTEVVEMYDQDMDTGVDSEELEERIETQIANLRVQQSFIANRIESLRLKKEQLTTKRDAQGLLNGVRRNLAGFDEQDVEAELNRISEKVSVADAEREALDEFESYAEKIDTGE